MTASGKIPEPFCPRSLSGLFKKALFMKKYTNEIFVGERALYASSDLKITDSVFKDGESHLKESRDLDIENCIFEWKYPLWNCTDVKVKDSTLLTTARSGIWYTSDIVMENCTIDAPKTFRRANGIALKSCHLPNAEETLWSCNGIVLDDVQACGDYFGINSSDVRANGLMLSGNYAFDGGKNIEISNSRLISKDAFWNCENVTVKNSTVIGEYLGWNSKGLTFIDCTIESNQGLCYIDGLTLIRCKLINTDLAFEYCKDVDADVIGHVISIKNPTSGSISADSIGEIILDDKFCDPTKTKITLKDNV